MTDRHPFNRHGRHAAVHPRQIATDKILKWLIFDVILASLTLGMTLVNDYLQASPQGVKGALERGELLLVSTGIVATTLGDLIIASIRSREGRRQTGKFLLIASGIAFIVTSVIFYQSIDPATGLAEEIRSTMTERTVHGSVTLFCTGLLLSLACLVLAELG